MPEPTTADGLSRELEIDYYAAKQPDSDHYVTISAERGRLTAHITCTAGHGSLCRLDCAEPGCTQEEQPPHTDHDGTRVHPHRDAGLCRVVEAVEARDALAAYVGPRGALGTWPVEAWLEDDGPRWRLTSLQRVVETGQLDYPVITHGPGEPSPPWLDWTADDEAARRNRLRRGSTPPFTPFPVSQFRAGFEQTRRDLDNVDPELDPSQPGFSPVDYFLALGRQTDDAAEDGAQ